MVPTMCESRHIYVHTYLYSPDWGWFMPHSNIALPGDVLEKGLIKSCLLATRLLVHPNQRWDILQPLIPTYILYYSFFLFIYIFLFIRYFFYLFNILFYCNNRFLVFKTTPYEINFLFVST